MVSLDYLKAALIHFPYPIGKLVSKVPFKYRPFISKGYSLAHKEATSFEELNAEMQKVWIFSKFKKLVTHAYNNTKFYKQLYDNNSFLPEHLKDFNDLNKIPIINKEMLQAVSIDDRSVFFKNRSLVNTGGSTGKPFGFYITPSSVPHEWYYTHQSWSSIGFKQSDLKIMFSGRSEVKNIIDYDSARHSLVVNIYVDKKTIADKLYDCCLKYKPTFIHGYPSAIFDFMLWIYEENHPLFIYFKKSIKGLIFSSEFPAAPLRQRIKDIYGIKTLSFYGHTERCIFASEMGNEYIYHPFQTYGFAEAIEIESGHSLVGTSYNNFTSPLIRYDTGDQIEPLSNTTILTSFKIAEGRKGEYILDKNGTKIFLTGLIFGRHHKVFEFVSSLQVYQKRPGHAIILLVPLPSFKLYEQSIARYFDSSNVEVDFEFTFIDSAIKTVSGKSSLLVRSLNTSNA